MIRLFIEIFIIGIVLAIIGSVVGKFISFFSADLPLVCKNWNQFYIMEITLFLIGVITHLTFEFSGVNRWYCRNGYACRNM
jgi:hypothetical protein